jgi:Leucine-rich repeat (LRR) protein
VISTAFFHPAAANEINGPLPAELGLLSALTQLYLDGNKLTGTLPTELGLMTDLTYLGLSFNKLTGTLPTELGLLSYLTWLHLSDNQLSGTLLPTELFGLSRLHYLQLAGNTVNLLMMNCTFVARNDHTLTCPSPPFSRSFPGLSARKLAS